MLSKQVVIAILIIDGVNARAESSVNIERFFALNFLLKINNNNETILNSQVPQAVPRR